MIENSTTLKMYKCISLLLMICIFTYYSCTPDDDIQYPENYTEYITISFDQYPSISPDGKWLVYFHKYLGYPEPEDYRTGLYITSTSNFNPKLLLAGQHYQPDWSPDGNWIVFSSAGTLQMINFKGDSIYTFNELEGIPLFFPDWSSNSESILFSSPYVNGGGGFICSSSFDNYRQLFMHSQLNAYPVKWLEDNEIVGCAFSNDWSGEEIIIIDTTLNNYQRLTFNNTSDRDPSYSIKNKYLTWSRDLQIMLMSLDEKIETSMDYGQYPNWVPDSNIIVYSSFNHDYSKEVIWLIDINNKNKTQLTY